MHDNPLILSVQAVWLAGLVFYKFPVLLAGSDSKPVHNHRC
ncbi:MAG: hypothetical protein ACTSUE_23175 [Promethearchaeota archaeon]